MNDRAIRIKELPGGVNPELAPVLVGLTIRLRTELIDMARAMSHDSVYYYLRNDDIQAALTAKLGVSDATRYTPYLLPGRPLKLLRIYAEEVVPTIPSDPSTTKETT